MALGELGNLRLRLAELQIRRRELGEDARVERAAAEQRKIDEAGGVKALGGNAEERERALLLALAVDLEYQRFMRSLWDTEAAIDRVQAQLETLVDDRRSREWAIRERLVDALLARAIWPATATARVNGDEETHSTFDDVLDGVTIEELDGVLVELPF